MDEPNTITWHEAVTDFLMDVKGTKEAKTHKFYQSRLLQLQSWAEDNQIALSGFRALHMRRYMAHRSEVVNPKTGTLLSTATRRSDAIAARVFLRFCVREGHLTADPLKEYKIPKAETAPVKCPTQAELQGLLRAITTRWDVRENPKARYLPAKDRHFWRLRDGALLCLLIETGLRISEACALTLQDYQPEQGRIQVRQSKTDMPRDVPITPTLTEYLRPWLAERQRIQKQSDAAIARGKELTCSPHLILTQFGGPVQPGTWSKAFRKYLEFAGQERFTRHAIRHFTATQLVARNPRTAQIVLGHANISTTMRYDHTAFERAQADHADVSPLGKILVHKRSEPTKKRRKII